MNLLIIIWIFLLIFPIQAAYPQSGTPDPTFGENGERLVTFDRTRFPDDKGGIVKMDTSGKILVAGTVSCDAYHAVSIIRLHKDGSVDSSFSEDGKLLIPADTSLIDKTLTFDIDGHGNMLLAGQLDRSGFCIIRLDGEGKSDTAFGNKGKVMLSGFNGHMQMINMDFDSKEKIVLSGYSTNEQGTMVLRLNRDGSSDSTFSCDGNVLFLKSGLFMPNTFTIDSRDRLLLAGSYRYSDDNRSMVVIRLKNDGDVDSTFGEIPGPRGRSMIYSYNSTHGTSAEKILVDSLGRILVALSTGTDYYPWITLVRLTEDGPGDSTFNGGALEMHSNLRYLSGMAIDRKGRIFVAGSGQSADYSPYWSINKIYCFTSNGLMDSTFSAMGQYTDGTFGDSYGYLDMPVYYSKSLLLDYDERILLAGTAINTNNLDFRITRLSGNGMEDINFNTTGTVWINGNDSLRFSIPEKSAANSLIMDHSGRMIMAGYSKSTHEGFYPERYDNCIVRLGTNGNLDSSFNNTGKIIIPVSLPFPAPPQIACDENNKILVSGFRSKGHNWEFYLQRFNDNGQPDAGFGKNGIALLPIMPYLTANVLIDIDQSGRIWLIREGYGDMYDCILRLTPDGLADTTFNGTGKLEIHDLDLADLIYHSFHGELYILGSFPLEENYHPKILKISDQGITDTLMHVIFKTVDMNVDGHPVSLRRYYMDGSEDSTLAGQMTELKGIGSAQTSWMNTCVNDSNLVWVGSLGRWETCLSRTIIDETPDTTFARDVKMDLFQGKNYDALVADCDYIWLAGQDSSETCFVITKLFARNNQTVDFFLPDTLNVGDPPLKLTGEASSGLPVNYTSNDPGLARISHDTLTILGEGTVVISAVQAGDGSFYAADTVKRTLYIKDILTSTAKENTEHGLSVFPNPVSGILYLESHGKIRSVVMSGTDGRILYQMSGISNYHISIDVSGYNPGCYILTVQPDADRPAQVMRFLKY